MPKYADYRPFFSPHYRTLLSEFYTSAPDFGLDHRAFVLDLELSTAAVLSLADHCLMGKNAITCVQ